MSYGTKVAILKWWSRWLYAARVLMDIQMVYINVWNECGLSNCHLARKLIRRRDKEGLIVRFFVLFLLNIGILI